MRRAGAGLLALSVVAGFWVGAAALPAADAQGGAVTEVPLPAGHDGPWGITAGPSGHLWVTEDAGAVQPLVAELATDGTLVQELVLPANDPALQENQLGTPGPITTGADGNLWFGATFAGEARIGRVTASGSLTEYPLPRRLEGVAGFGAHPLLQLSDPRPEGITAGPDGAVWFTEPGTDAIGRMTTAGTVTNEYVLPTPNAGPWRIT